MDTPHSESKWSPYLQRYLNNEWRGTIFRDMIIADANSLEQQRGKLSFLDIGCGRGFDGDSELQRSLANLSGKYFGIEPENTVEVADFFSTTYRCNLEDAPIQSDSIDIAFAFMVLEHFKEPQKCWNKIYNILNKGGIFWGFTVDSRHWVKSASLLADRIGLKDMYLSALSCEPGKERSDSYKAKQIQSQARLFSSMSVLNFIRVGQDDRYMPKKLRWVNRSYDRLAIRFGLPGSILAVRLVK